jgi:hypothetical protein
MVKATAKPLNRRGSPEAIQKRRAARQFNDVLGGRGASAQKLDGRTEKRRQRLLKELADGVARGRRDLKPLDVLQRVQELMDLGETLGSIRKVAKVRKTTLDPAAVLTVVQRLHEAYKFRPEAYRFVGIGDDVLRGAGVLGPADAAESKREGGASVRAAKAGKAAAGTKPAKTPKKSQRASARPGSSA